MSGLAVRDGARRITLGMLAEQESADLIAAATRGYRTGDDPAQIAEPARLCARLPLALRIAADQQGPWGQATTLHHTAAHHTNDASAKPAPCGTWVGCGG
ncbi:hypothetical protein [Streptomyces antimycoticus]|uniref:hypothetical protein n=1 Tax=Streptomyces antimycoticus TaxID=68175 RepID=UPI003F4D8A33